MDSRPRINRGPAAAADNRAALLAAARSLFAARGYDVPLRSIAADAGVGQGVLYRHFPTRLDLAFAVFEDHFHRYREIAAGGGPDAFGALWREIVGNVIDETAFVDMVTDARRSQPDYDGIVRLRAILTGPLQRAVAAGRIPADVTVDEVVLGIRMAYGIVRTAEDGTTAEELRATIGTALPRLDPR